MRTNHVKDRLRRGEPSIGTWLSLPSPEAAEYVSRLPVDWLVVDTEHNPIDITTLSQMFMAISGTGVAPMVRIPWNTPEHFKRVLDAGAWGIVTPMVNSREEAESAVQAARYHPLGNRSVGGGRHGFSFDTTAIDYYRNANEQVLLIMQIEHIDGVNNVEEIVSVPGIDAVYIGPNDLAASMGLGLGVPLEHDDPDLVRAIHHVRDVAKARGLPTGIHTSSAAGVNQRLGEGFQFCAMASELRYMVAGIIDDLREIDWKASSRTETLDIDETEARTVVRY